MKVLSIILLIFSISKFNVLFNGNEINISIPEFPQLDPKIIKNLAIWFIVLEGIVGIICGIYIWNL